jgi:hypothetical protein
MSAITLRAPAAFGLPSPAAIDAEGRRRDPLMWGFAIVLLVGMLPLVAAYALDGRTVNDVNVWGKPLKFAGSLALYFATLAWFRGYLPATRGRWLDRFAILSVVLVAAEMLYIVLQSARGVGSHFNTATPLEGALFTVMGVAALIFTTLPLALAVGIARAPAGGLAPAYRLAVILGLVLTTLLGASAGVAIAMNGGHWVAAPHTDAGGFPIFGWTRDGGDLRVAHFFGIHAMQILPVAGWLVARRVPEGRGIVWLIAAAFAALTVATFVEALAGRPFLGFLG